MVYSPVWRFDIRDGKVVIVTGNYLCGESIFQPEDSEIQLRQNAIVFKRHEADDLYHELPFKNHKIDRYTPSIEELQNLGLLGGVDRTLLSCLRDIIHDYIMSKQKVFVNRPPFNLDYWLEKYKEYSDVLNSIDLSEALEVVPIKK